MPSWSPSSRRTVSIFRAMRGNVIRSVLRLQAPYYASGCDFSAPLAPPAVGRPRPGTASLGAFRGWGLGVGGVPGPVPRGPPRRARGASSRFRTPSYRSGFASADVAGGLSLRLAGVWGLGCQGAPWSLRRRVSGQGLRRMYPSPPGVRPPSPWRVGGCSGVALGWVLRRPVAALLRTPLAPPGLFPCKDQGTPYPGGRQGDS